MDPVQSPLVTLTVNRWMLAPGVVPARHCQAGCSALSVQQYAGSSGANVLF